MGGPLGGSVVPEGNGFKATMNGKIAAFGPDSRFAVIGEDLIEMPVAPITVENRPFVAWQFFQGILGKSADLDVVWDSVGRILTVKPAQHVTVGVQVSVANVQGISKVVFDRAGYKYHGRVSAVAAGAREGGLEF